MPAYGSVNNALYDNATNPVTPEIGMPCTLLMWSDRDPMTIVAITRFKTGARRGEVKSVTARRNVVTADRSQGELQMGHQNWLVSTDLQGMEHEFTIRKDGAFRDSGGNRLMLGGWSVYHDWSF